MKILFDTDIDKIKVDCLVEFSGELENGKVRFSIEDGKTTATLGDPVCEDEGQEEEKFRSAIKNVLQYCVDNKINNLSIDLSSIDKEILAYVASNIIESADEFSLWNNDGLGMDLVLYLPTGVMIESAEQSFERIKERFNEFDKWREKEPSFRGYLINLIKEKRINKNSTVYKKAGISKHVFSKITDTLVEHKPSKDTVAALAIGLELDLEEAQMLYNSAGYYLGNTDFVDRVIRFFISEKEYDILEVNYLLHEYGHRILGEKLRNSNEKDRDNDIYNLEYYIKQKEQVTK